MSSPRYPSWLPQRPPPPVPSTYDSMPASLEDHVARVADTHPTAMEVFRTLPATQTPPQTTRTHPGRKPTPRSVRIVGPNVLQGAREPTGDSAETRVALPEDPARPVHHPRRVHPHPHPAPPRFNAPHLNLALLRSPSRVTRLLFFLHPLRVYGHLLLMSWLDLSAVEVLVGLLTHPAPAQSPSWRLALAAYLACYVLHVFGVCVVYEGVFLWWRRWRGKRPLILPIYLSAPAHNLAMLTSYDVFCFMRHVRGGVGIGGLGGSLPRLPGTGVPALTRLWGARGAAQEKDVPTPTPAALHSALASPTSPSSPLPSRSHAPPRPSRGRARRRLPPSTSRRPPPLPRPPAHTPPPAHTSPRPRRAPLPPPPHRRPRPHTPTRPARCTPSRRRASSTRRTCPASCCCCRAPPCASGWS
ncbi:hypothetical protein JB92DRAFT_1879872 [Gautieria morchelliformis]|nr:hypothetical protein JB92DRAFT_1879872 [Gautieria morchelliformis]